MKSSELAMIWEPPVVPPTSSLFSWGAAKVAQLEGVEMTVHVHSEGEPGTRGYAASPG